MEDSICVSSDSNPSSSPPTLLAVDLDDDFEYPKAKLSEICGSSMSLKIGNDFTIENAKGDVPECVIKSELPKNILRSRLAAQRGPNRSKIDVAFDDMPGPSNESAEQNVKCTRLPVVSSFHELSDSDADDTTNPDSPQSPFEGVCGGENVPGNSIIRDLVNEPPGKRTVTVPMHDLSDSDNESDRTIPAVESLSNMSVGMDENTWSYPGATTVSVDPRSPESAESTEPFPSTADLRTADNGSALLQSNSEPLFSTSYSISDFVTQLSASSQPLNMISGPKPTRKRTKNSVEDIIERKRLKEIREKEKAEKAAAVESLRRLRPGECLKYVTVLLDDRIITEYPWGKAVVRILELMNVKHEVKVTTDPCAVQWTRDQVGSLTPVEEGHIIFFWSVEKLLTSIQLGTFIDTFAVFKNKYSTHKLLLAVYGLHEYYKKLSRKNKKRSNESRNPNGSTACKRKAAYEVTETQIEVELIALQVRLGISHKVVNSPQDAACFLQVITKSVAELPFKLERERIDEKRNWYAKGDSRNCVRIDKDFNGMSQLWLQQLAQYNNSSLDTAKSIALIYPSPISLYDAYQAKATTKEKEQMLQEIVVKRGASGGGRRLGPELSKKISIMFCQDEDVPLG